MNIFVFMISVVIIGYGKVAFHLTNVFRNSDTIIVKQVYSRSMSKIEHLRKNINITNDITKLVDADVYIIAVSDDAIAEVSSKITNTKALIVHTSGTFDLKGLQTKNRKGVFYPLQSFSIEKAVDFNEVPFCLETEYQKDFLLLETLALSISKKVYQIDSQQRQYLHVAAVFVNNFSNHMFSIGNDICKVYNVPFERLHPLIKETATKVEKLAPKNAQTGPAIRNDQKTMKKHLKLLTEPQQIIYNLISKSIQNG